MNQSDTPPPTPLLAAHGTPAYFPSLLSLIYSTHPAFPLEPVVLQSLLLCLISRVDTPSTLVKGNQHDPTDVCGADSGNLHRDDIWSCANLILRTREEDVALLVHLVSLTLTTVFGLPTHKHKISPTPKRPTRGKHAWREDRTESPDAFLRALFFRRPSPSPSARLSADMSPWAGSRPPGSPALGNRHSSFHTSRPSPLRLSRSIEKQPGETNADGFFDEISLASSRRPLISASTPSSTLRSRRTYGERLPLFLDEESTSLASAGGRRAVQEVDIGEEQEEDNTRPLATLSKAVVVSGLEYSSLPVQRELSQVLSDRRLMLEESINVGDTAHFGGTWNLPSDFLMVYVCKTDGHERPALSGALLDKFAMSADITITSSTRQAYNAYRGTPGPTPHASPFVTPHSLPTPTEHSPSAPLRSPNIRSPCLPSVSKPLLAPVLPPVPPSELATLRALASPFPCGAHAHTNMNPFLASYLSNLFYAARHHPLLDGMLLTRRAHVVADALVRAFRVLAGDSVGAELLGTALPRGLGPDGTSTEMSGDSVSAAESAEWDKDVISMDWAERDATPKQGEGSVLDDSADGPMRVNLPFGSPVAEDDSESGGHLTVPRGRESAEVWDISEVDVARVFSRVVSHRLRVRGGPDEEVLASVNWPAVSGAPSQEEPSRDEWNRKNVKEILVQILGDV